MIRVVLCDSNEFIRLGVSYLFDNQHDIQLVGEVDDCSKLVQLCSLVKPDVVLVSLELNIADMEQQVAEILQICPSVLFFTQIKDRDLHLHMLRLGVVGIVTHNQGAEMLVKAVLAVHRGEMWFDRSVALDLLRRESKSYIDNIPAAQAKRKVGFENYNLTARELEIARYAANGQSAKAISEKLCVSEKTIRNLLVAIYSKLRVSSQVELVLLACRLREISGERISADN